MGRLVLSPSSPAHHALRTAQKVLGNGGKYIRDIPRVRYSTRRITTASTVASRHADIARTSIETPRAASIEQSPRAAIKDAKPFSDFLTDTYKREHNYLRISLTERCNLRCLYCMPEEGVPLSPPDDTLTTPEIFYLSSLFVSQGVTKIRLTGGEPTVRRDLLPLMHQLGSLRAKGLTELAITTNGIALHRKLDSMAEAGLTGVNLSLDTLDPFQFQIMTRRKGFDAVWKSIERILEMNKLGAGIKLKVNCVVMRGLNDREIIPFVELGREKDIETRFIEYMPFGGNKWSKGKMLPYQEMLDIIRSKYPGLQKVQDHKNDTSKTFQIPGFVGKMGFITSMTHNFCGTCNRLRITSDGNLKVCLFGNEEVSLRDILRKGNNDRPIDEAAFEALKQIEMDRHQGRLPEGTPLGWGEREKELLNVIGAAVKRKEEGHAVMGELEHMKNRPMILIGERAQVQHQPSRHQHQMSRRLTPNRSTTSAPWLSTPLHLLQGAINHPLTWRASYATQAKGGKSRIIVTSGLRTRKAVPSQAWRFVRGPKEKEEDLSSAEEVPTPPTNVTPTISFSEDSYQQLVDTVVSKEPPFATIMMYNPQADRYTLVQSQNDLRRLRTKLGSQVSANDIQRERIYVYNLETQAFSPVSSSGSAPAIRLLYRRLLMRSSSSFRRVGDTPGLSGQTLENLRRKKFPSRNFFYFRSIRQNQKQRASAIIEAKRRKRIKKAQILALKKVTSMAQQRERLLASQPGLESEPEGRYRLKGFQISQRPLRARIRAARSGKQEQDQAKVEEYKKRALAKAQSKAAPDIEWKRVWTPESPLVSSSEGAHISAATPVSGQENSELKHASSPSDELTSMSSHKSATRNDQERRSTLESSAKDPKSEMQEQLKMHSSPRDRYIPDFPNDVSQEKRWEYERRAAEVREYKAKLKKLRGESVAEPPPAAKGKFFSFAYGGTYRPSVVPKGRIQWSLHLQKDELQKDDPQKADLQKADLQKADLQKADLQKPPVQSADVHPPATIQPDQPPKKVSRRPLTFLPRWGPQSRQRSPGRITRFQRHIVPTPLVLQRNPSDELRTRPSFLNEPDHPSIASPVEQSETPKNPSHTVFRPSFLYEFDRPSFSYLMGKSKVPGNPSSRSRSFSTSASKSSSPQLTHLDTAGAAHMVSITSKPSTARRAVATGRIIFSNPSPADLIARNAVKKGDVLAIARVAGIMAAKRTPDLIPLCHPIALSSVAVDLDLRVPQHSAEETFGHIDVTATVECTGATGVEMEALMAVWGATATVYDMCKAVDKGMRIDGVKVVLKEGGRSGTFVDGAWDAARQSTPLSSAARASKPSSPPSARGFSTSAILSGPAPPGQDPPPPQEPPQQPQQQQLHPYFAQKLSSPPSSPQFTHSVVNPSSPANAQNSLLLMLPLAIMIAVLGGAIVFRKVYTQNANPNRAFEKGRGRAGAPAAKEDVIAGMGAKVAKVTRKTGVEEGRKGVEEGGSAIGKGLVIGMLVVWPVLHILWILTNSRS